MQQIVHNQANLHEYNLFASGSNDFLKLALFVSPGNIEILSDYKLLAEADELLIGEIDYTRKDPVTGNFPVINQRQAKPKADGNRIVIQVHDFNDQKNYMLIFRGMHTPVFLDPATGGILDTHFNASDEQEFGVRLRKNKAYFKLWSPPAGRVELLLFHPDGSPLVSSAPLEMKKGKNGVWTLELNNLDQQDSGFEGMLYQYVVYAYGKKYIALDPYAFSMPEFDSGGKDNIGRGAIVRMDSPSSKPLKFERNYSNAKAMANVNDLITWELHVRDCTSEPGTVPHGIAGTYVGCIEKIPYIKELGVTHVQFMPLMKFYTVNESDKSFSGKEAQQVNYNWGYDPMNYFTPEGWYSTDFSNPYVRIKELRSLIQELHDNGIGVILDVAYNHTHIVETFENVAPGCYYRLNDQLKISGHSGAGPSLESRRPMVRKLIIDSMLHFIREYHVDGFRIDLMSFFDHETMLMIREYTGKAYDQNNPDALILQGEAWMFSDLDLSPDAMGINAAVTKLNYPEQLKELGIFNDVARDAICGKEMMHGFVHGNPATVPGVASSVSGGVKSINPGSVPFNNDEFFDPYSLFANTSANCINFLSIHDGLTLWDKLRLSVPGMSLDERALMMRMASLILFTSAGKIILHGGDEILRTKPLSLYDKVKDRAYSALKTEPVDGVKIFHENSYCSADFTNMIRWDKFFKDTCVREMHEYYKGLILLRRSFPAFRSEPQGQHGSNLRFLTSHRQIDSEMPSVFLSFHDSRLNSLTIRFINGPPGRQFYIAGEIHRKGISDNPEHNPFVVQFDHTGNGEIIFHREDIMNFDLQKWGNNHRLEIKLVKEQGSWESVPEAYSRMGSNSIDARSLDQKGCVIIDLSKMNFAPVRPAYKYDHYIAYLMDNNPDLKPAPGYTNYQADKVLVIHNPSDKDVEVPVPEIEHPDQWHVIADAYSAGITPLAFSANSGKGASSVQIHKGKLYVPGKNAAVVVK
jgi:pullulanase